MEKRVSVGVGLAFVAMLLSVLMVACGSAEEAVTATMEKEQGLPADLDSKALTEERCTKCHTLERVEAASKTSEEWITSVERMVGKGAELDEAEQKAVIEYLSEAYPK